ncbi:MAG: thioredoxin domain-containing protein, partial [Actinomycetota bacterium]
MQDQGRKPNRLAGETSPYLLQHAYNPVDWHPWGPEALEKARVQDMPILLSIGYAACHWCHVMERESFEDESTAVLMNEKFVCIKVDREERPDIDAIYMDAVQAMTGRGGWPMTMFLTPQGKPFFGGTYFPPEDRYGMPGFKSVLKAVHQAFVSKRQDVEKQTDVLVEHIRGQTVAPSGDPLTGDLLPAAIERISAQFDFISGGFAGAPKFPNTPSLEFLLRGSAKALGRAPEMLSTTLRKMAAGGIYDQIGGGFARYSVDDDWLVPHFEKMLYDNAQLARVYIR